jgi:hypothetical protein
VECFDLDRLSSPVGALNDKYDWEANPFGLKFVDPNIWLENGDFARD